MLNTLNINLDYKDTMSHTSSKRDPICSVEQKIRIETISSIFLKKNLVF